MMKPLLLFLLLAALGGLTEASRAATSVTVDSNATGPMDGFDLFNSGLYWWNNGVQAGENTPGRLGQVGLKTLLAGRSLVFKSTATVFSLQGYDLSAASGQSVARTDDSLFYFVRQFLGSRIFKRPLFGAAVSNPGIDFSGVTYGSVGSILVHGGTVYWAVRGDSASNDGEVRWKFVNGGPGGGDTILGSGMGLVKKMRMIPLLDEDGNFRGNYLFLLNTDGQLWHIRMPSFLGLSTGPPTFYAGNVTDFDVRHESYDLPNFRTIHATRLYAAMGADLSSSRVSGRLLSYNLTSGGIVTEHDSQNINLQVTGVTMDGDRLFITRTPLWYDGVAGGFGRWDYDKPNAQILRKVSPAFVHSPTVVKVFETISILQEGGQLRSDGQWLYYTHQNQIRKIKTESPAIALDYRAIGLEVVQAVQDYNNSVPLVAGKPTLVRAYAQKIIDTTGLGPFPLVGRLRASQGGVPLSGEAWAWNDPIVDGVADLRTLRTNLTRSFLFDLPQEWMNEVGLLQLQFTVNPNGTAPETGDTPLINNDASATVTVNHLGTPCLVFNVMKSGGGGYDPTAPGSGFGDIIDRSLSLLPVPGFRYGIRAGLFSKPVVTLFGIKDRSFDMPDDSSWALTLLSAVQWLSKDPAHCPDTHWVGMFPAWVKEFNGRGETDGNTLLIRMGADKNDTWNQPRGGFALAHELSHNYGRNHINTPKSCSNEPPDAPLDVYNGDPCTLGITIDLNDSAAPIGYDYRTGTLILPAMAGDLMTYATNRWMSSQTWRANINSIPGRDGPAAGLAPVAPSPDGPVLFVQGLLNTAAPSGLLLPLIQGEPGVFDDARIADSIAASQALPPDAPFRLIQLDAGGTLLSDFAAVTSGFTDGPADQLKFDQFLPRNSAAVRVQLVGHGRVLAESIASASAPVVSLDAPALDPVNETLSLSWIATDAENDPMLFTVQFTPDDGLTWQTLRAHDPSLGLAISTRLLPGGDACRLRVLAADGFHTTLVSTEPFPLAKHAPFITLAGLREQQRLPYGTNLTVRGYAYDAEDGSLDAAAVHWELAGPEPRSGNGGFFSLRDLAPGVHTLTVSATDAEGNAGANTFNFTVLPLAVPDTAAPVLDGLGTDSAYAGAPSVRIVPGRAEPSVRFVHADGALYVCFNGLPLSDAGTTPANINFYVNTDGTAPAAPRTTDYGFGVDENGVTYESRGNGAGLSALLTRDFTVQIMQGVNAWSAEFRVPDALLGGWNHDARLAIYFLRSRCLPVFGCLEVSDSPLLWPATADLSQPGTWAPVIFGPPTTPANSTPTALASGPAAVSFSERQTLALDGSGSYDLDGDALTFAWTQTSGPAVSLDDPASPTPSFTTPALGAPEVVTFQLIVNDGQADSAPASVAITLKPVGTVTTAVKGGVSLNVADGSARVELCWPGSPGEVAVVQASTDLVTWESIATNTVGTLNTILHLDLNAGSFPFRFYRAVSWSPDTNSIAGHALEFDGVDDRVVVPHGDSLNAFPLTLTFWVKTSDTGTAGRGLVSKYYDGSANGYALFLNGGHVRGSYFANGTSYLWDGALGFDSGFIADERWHHLALIVDNSGGRLLVDGFTVSSLAWSSTPGAPTTAEPLQFGHYSFYPVSLVGQLDEIALWNRAFTDAEIRAGLHHMLTGVEANLIGYWPFNELDGDTARDATGQAHDGAMLNGTTRVVSAAPIFP
jgi:hypothetical protein